MILTHGANSIGSGGGGPVVPTGYVRGILKKSNNNNTGITTDANKLKTSDTCIIETLFYVKGGYAGWGSDIQFFALNSRNGSIVKASLRNNTSTNECSPSLDHMYNTTSYNARPIEDFVHILLNENEGLWNDDNTYGKNGRITGVFTNNGIKQIFYGGDWNGEYAGTIFYYLSIMDNGVYTHYLVPAKKQADDSIVVLDLVTLDEYPVNTSNFEFIQQ